MPFYKFYLPRQNGAGGRFYPPCKGGQGGINADEVHRNSPLSLRERVVRRVDDGFLIPTTPFSRGVKLIPEPCGRGDRICKEAIFFGFARSGAAKKSCFFAYLCKGGGASAPEGFPLLPLTPTLSLKGRGTRI